MSQVRLPGGLLADGVVHREARFRPLTGAVELALEEARAANLPYPVFVTQALCAAVESIGGIPFSTEVARALSVADRQVLLLELSKMISGDRYWLQPECPACGKRFDLLVSRSAIPVTDAPGAYPVFDGTLGGQPVKLRTITGGVEERLARTNDDDSAYRVLLDHCVVRDGQRTLESFGEDEWTELEKQIEAGSPQVADEVASRCPYCERDVTLEIDFSVGLADCDSILVEIHRIASHYHWSEESIAALPRRRRRTYLKMIGAEHREERFR